MSGALMGMIAGNKTVLDAIYKAIGRRVIQSWDTDDEWKQLIGHSAQKTPYSITGSNSINETQGGALGVTKSTSGATTMSLKATCTIDTTNISTIDYDIYIKSTGSSNYADYYFKVGSIYGFNVLNGANFDGTKTGSIDVSGLTGLQTLEIYSLNEYGGASVYVTIDINSLKFDGVETVKLATSSSNNLIASTNISELYTPVFSPSDLSDWDIFIANYESTNVSFDIIDGSTYGVLQSNINNGDSMSQVPQTSKSIQIKVKNLETNDKLFSVGLAYLA